MGVAEAIGASIVTREASSSQQEFQTLHRAVVKIAHRSLAKAD
jgi:hypothetical protein